MNRISRYSLTGSWAAIAFFAAGAAAAQDTNADQSEKRQGDTGDVIIVRALKQGDSLLDTPATVAVVDQAELNTSNVSSARDLGGIVPSFSFMQGVAGGSASFRGLGSNSADPAIESSVGGFNDGVYLGHSRDFTTPLYDLQQIEFVAGTQSTVLGKNTSIGAVSLTSRRPGRTFAANGSATYTDKIDAVTLRAGIDIPLGPDFAVRIAGFYDDQQGYTRNNFVERNEQQLRDASGRIVLDGNISDNVRLTAIYQHDRRRGDGQYLELLNDPDGLFEFFSAAVLGLPDELIDTVADDATVNGNERLDPNDPDVPLPYDNQDGDRATAIVEIDTAGGGMLTAQTGYLNWDSQRLLDQDYTFLNVLNLLDDEASEVFSQELRFASPDSDTFTYLLGLYYYHNVYTLRRGVESDLGFALDGFTRVTTDSYSAFASGRYALNDTFALLGGLRYNLEDKRAFYEVTGNVAPPLGPVTTPNKNSDELDYNFGVEVTPGSSLLLYATYARGSKNGGFQSAPDELVVAEYDTEVAKTFEVGAKYDLGNGSIELVGYDTKIKDFQGSRVAPSPDTSIPVTQISNVDARTTGAEATLRYKLTSNFGINASLAYTDARFTEGLESEVDTGVFITEIYPGMRLPRAPKWGAKFGYNFSTPIGGSLEFSSNGVVRYQTEADLQYRASNPAAPVTKEHATVDMEVRIGDPDAGWSIAAIGNNLTNVRTTVFTSDWLLAGALDPTATPPYYGRRNRPRTFSIQAAFEF